MENRDQYKRLLMFLTSAIIVVVLTGIFAFVGYTIYADNEDILIKVFWQRGNYVVIGLYMVMTFLFFKLYGGFKVGYLRMYEVLYSQILSVCCINLITYLQLCLIGRWRFLSHIKPIIVMTVVDLIVVCIWVMTTRWIFLKIYPPRKLVLVYGKYEPDDLIQKIGTRKDKYTIMESISCTEDFELIKEKIREYRGALLLDIPSQVRNQILKFCFENDIRCYSVPKISDIMIKSAEDIHLFDTSLLLFRNKGLSIEQQIFKRLFDVVASLIAIAVASPVMLVIAVCIKLYDRGPVLFTQDRLTKDGKLFKVYKFRSMHVQQETGEYCMTRKNDDRVTPVGKVLRNIHFDELPQLFNILKGEMSFVGPRPECPQIAEKYKKTIPEFDFRLKVKAGLTGFAQIYGKYNTTPYDKLKLDLTYIENYSFLLDIKLMMLTFKILFQKENTEGIEQWQNDAGEKNKAASAREEEVSV